MVNVHSPRENQRTNSMRNNYKLTIIASIVTAVVVGAILGMFGEALGIPKSWNTALVGGFAGAVASIVGQKSAQPNNEE